MIRQSHLQAPSSAWQRLRTGTLHTRLGFRLTVAMAADWEALTELPPTLQTPMVYLDSSNASKLCPEPAGAGWYDQIQVSTSLFGKSGGRYVSSTLAKVYPSHFVWATQFSNVHTTFSFQEPGFELDGVTWPGPEQYFQAAKMGPEALADPALIAPFLSASPSEAFALGRSVDLVDNWEEIKDDVMLRAITAKFNADASLAALLISTHPHPLVQIKPGDSYWGTGPSGKGANVLGLLLQSLRDSLRDAR